MERGNDETETIATATEKMRQRQKQRRTDTEETDEARVFGRLCNLRVIQGELTKLALEAGDDCKAQQRNKLNRIERDGKPCVSCYG